MHRKAKLASLLRLSRDGIQYVEHSEVTNGAIVFDHACRLGLEGIVSKRRDKPDHHGRSRTWLKVRNPASPAAKRIDDGTF
jgi:bifunctional non-homologous end joining protein LigD